MNSIRFHLFAAMFLAGLLPLALLSGFLQSNLSSSVIKDSRDRTATVINEVGRRIEAEMTGVENHLKSIQTNDGLANPAVSEEHRQKELNRMLNAYSNSFFDLSLYDAEGFLLLSTDTDSQVTARYLDHTLWFKKSVAENRRVVSLPKRAIERAELYMDVYLPLDNPYSEEVTHVVKASLRFNAIQQVLSSVDMGAEGYVILKDEFNNLLYHPDSDLWMSKHRERPGPDYWKEHQKGDFNDGKTDYLYASYLLSQAETRTGVQWVLIGFFPKSEALDLLNGVRKTLLLGWVLALICTITFGDFMARQLQRPIGPLAAAAKGVAAHEWNQIPHLEAKGPQEVRHLAQSFNQMVREIQTYQQTLEEKVAQRTRELQMSQEDLESAVAQLDASFQSSREGVLVVGDSDLPLTMNRKFREFFGLRMEGEIEVGELESEVQALVSDAGPFEGFHLPLRDSRSQEAEWHVLAEEERFLDVYSVPVKNSRGEALARMWVFRDFTEQRRLEESLQQAQKMEAVGRLAGGIAHDFNNLLTGVIGNLSMMDYELEENATGQLHLRSARQAAQRAADLVKKLLGFSRQSFLKLRPWNLNDSISEVAELIRPGIDPRVEIRVEKSTDRWIANVDDNQINQVLMNLCVNARDAMDSKDGAITLKADNVKLGIKEALRLGAPEEQARGGDFIKLSVQDTGSGIDPKNLGRIFEPFFTTKEQGKGTGLGLATSYGIVEQHGGWMKCESELGKGTTFSIYLPRDMESAPLVEEEEKDHKAPVYQGGTERILIVDDEMVVRLLAEQFLRKQGYSILSASDGEEAVKVFEANQHQIDLIILDLTMPRMSGDEAFKKIREISPDMPAIISSGHIVDLDGFQDENGEKPNAFLCKPWELESMSDTVRKVLEGDEESAVAA